MNDNIGPPFLDPTRLGPSDWQPIGAAVFGIAALGLGLKDVIAYRTLAGYVVALGIICGLLALALAVNGEKRPKPRSVAWMFWGGSALRRSWRVLAGDRFWPRQLAEQRWRLNAPRPQFRCSLTSGTSHRTARLPSREAAPFRRVWTCLLEVCCHRAIMAFGDDLALTRSIFKTANADGRPETGDIRPGVPVKARRGWSSLGARWGGPRPPSRGRRECGLKSPIHIAFAFLVAILGLVVGTIRMGPAISAAESHGTRGYFVAQYQTCTRNSCSWKGDFELSDGAVTRSHIWFYGSAPAMTAGTTVPAVDTGDPFGVYQPHSSQWLLALGPLLLGVGFLLVAAQWARARWSASGAGPASETEDQPASWLGPRS
jgi:hypothetical protein